jgi:hypothetical protein
MNLALPSGAWVVVSFGVSGRGRLSPASCMVYRSSRARWAKEGASGKDHFHESLLGRLPRLWGG